MKTKKPWAVIMKRELASYFSSPVAYIVCGLFLIFSGILFFSTFFIAGKAELRGFFGMLPLLFSLFIPALTMRVFSEELRSGTIETLLTLPVSPAQVVAGKYLASLVASLVLLVPTLSYVLACCVFGSPDMGRWRAVTLAPSCLPPRTRLSGCLRRRLPATRLSRFLLQLPCVPCFRLQIRLWCCCPARWLRSSLLLRLPAILNQSPAEL